MCLAELVNEVHRMNRFITLLLVQGYSAVNAPSFAFEDVVPKYQFCTLLCDALSFAKYLAFITSSTHSLIHHPCFPICFFFHRERLPRIFFNSPVPTPKLPRLLCQLLGPLLLPVRLGTLSGTVGDGVTTPLALGGVIKFRSRKVRRVVLAEENLGRGELLLVSVGNWNFDLDMVVEDVVAWTSESSFKSLTDLDGSEILKRERNPASIVSSGRKGC